MHVCVPITRGRILATHEKYYVVWVAGNFVFGNDDKNSMPENLDCDSVRQNYEGERETMAIRRINARQFLRDFRSGKDYVSLIRKYEISQGQLQALLNEFLESGLISDSELIEEKPTPASSRLPLPSKDVSASEPKGTHWTPNRPMWSSAV